MTRLITTYETFFFSANSLQAFLRIAGRGCTCIRDFFIILIELDKFNKIQFIKIIRDLVRDWTQIICLIVSHSNHYTRMFSVLLWGCNWMLFMHGWFCPISLIHLIGQKFLYFEKKIDRNIMKRGILADITIACCIDIAFNVLEWKSLNVRWDDTYHNFSRFAHNTRMPIFGFFTKAQNWQYCH